MSAFSRPRSRRGLVCRIIAGPRSGCTAARARSRALDAARLRSTLDQHDGCYFERPPERLVLEGYRRWLAGYDSGSVTPWEMTQALYEELLGAAEGRRVLAELSHFVRTLRQCAACPLRSFPFGAHHVCRDECLALGLIAALQHDDPRRRRDVPFGDRLPGALGRRRRGRSLLCRRAGRRRATICCRSRKARSRTCCRVPAPSAAPFTEEMTMTTTLSRARLLRTTGGDCRLDGADGGDLRAAGQGGHRPARR